MDDEVNIIAVVDVVGALSDEGLHNGNFSMMDNGRMESTGQGTPDLCTVCRPGQLVQWIAKAVDVQTPVDIRSITFLGPGGVDNGPADGASTGDDSERLGLNVWSGVVPPGMIPGLEYRYRIELQMYEGSNSIMSVDTCSLKFL